MDGIGKEAALKKGPWIACITIAVLSITISATAAEKIKMGYFNLIPHMFYDATSQKLQGASIDYFTAAASTMGYEVEWLGPLPFPRLIRYLKDGIVDGSLMMNKNPEREAFLLYPELPYHWVQRILVVKIENKLDKITSINDVLGYKIGFMKDAHLSPFIKDNMEKITLELIGGQDWVQQNLLKLKLGRLDAVYDLNAETMRYRAKQLNMDDTIKILKIPESSGGVNIVFSKASPKGRVLLERYQEGRQTLKWVYEDFLIPYME